MGRSSPPQTLCVAEGEGCARAPGGAASHTLAPGWKGPALSPGWGVLSLTHSQSQTCFPHARPTGPLRVLSQCGDLHVGLYSPSGHSTVCASRMAQEGSLRRGVHERAGCPAPWPQ